MKRKIKFIFLATTMVVASGTYCAFGAEQQETSAVQVIVENTQEATSPLETQGNGMTKNGVAGSVKATTEKEDKNITTVSLTLDEAVQKAIANSTSLKKLEADMDLADDDREKIYDAYAYSTSDDNLSSLLQLVQYQTDESNNRTTKEITEGKIKYEMQTAFINIINMENKIENLTRTIKNSEKELSIMAVKKDLNMITENEYNNYVLDLEKNKTELEKSKNELVQNYDAISLLIGGVMGTVYDLEITPTYEPLTVDGGIDSYVNRAISSDLNLKILQENLDMAKKELNAYTADQAGTYQSKKNEISNQGLSLIDSRDELESKIRSTYDSIVSLEKTYNNDVLELEQMEADYAVMEKKHELQMITDLELEKEKASIEEKKSMILSDIYEHMLLVEKFKTTYLLS